MNLEALGWDAFFERHAEAFRGAGLVPARVVRESREPYLVHGGDGERLAETTGRFRHEAGSRDAFPACGDWVMVQAASEGRAAIHALLPRRTAFARKAVGSRPERQVVAANVDTVFLVCALDGGRSAAPRRIERTLALAWESGAAPVIVLNKADLCGDIEGAVMAASAVAPGVDVLTVSAATGEGVDALRACLPFGRTGAMLGASGVGKSSLINRLAGEELLPVAEVRGKDLRGRHTTSRRELIPVPGGGLIMDTPGLRELQLWVGEASIDSAFEDVAELAAQCRFRDCRHEGEPGCAVQEALARGQLDPARYASYLHLRREQAYLARRHDLKARLDEKAKWRRISIWARQQARRNGGD